MTVANVYLVPLIRISQIAYRERCDEGTVLDLERKIEDYGMEWECTYDPM